jgi:hypothetical protein
MPLIKSKKPDAFKKNVATEVDALKAKGVKPAKAVKQAVAIAYDVRRSAGKKK